MGRQRYTPVLREELVRLVLEGQSVVLLAHDFKTLAATLPKWIGKVREPELVFSTSEMELLDQRRFAIQEEPRREIDCFIEGHYNSRRSHSALVYSTPVEYERLQFGTDRVRR